MQGTWVWSLVREVSTCHGATKLERRSYWAHLSRAHVPQQKKPLQWEAWALQLETSPRSQQLQRARVQATIENRQMPPIAATAESTHAATIENRQASMILRDKKQVTHSMVPFIEAVKPGELVNTLFRDKDLRSKI